MVRALSEVVTNKENLLRILYAGFGFGIVLLAYSGLEGLYLRFQVSAAHRGFYQCVSEPSGR